MKRIDSCRKTDLLVGLLFAGVVAVLLAYRIFAYLCEVTAFQWWMVLLGVLSAVLGIRGCVMGRREWKLRQNDRDDPEEAKVI